MPPKSKFYWYDGEKDAILTAALIEEEGLEYGVCLYDSEDEAYDALEGMADQVDDVSDLYGLTLKRTGNMTMGEAQDVLTEQTGFDSFTDDD